MEEQEKVAHKMITEQTLKQLEEDLKKSIVNKLIKDFRGQKVKDTKLMPYVTAKQFNKIMDRFIDYLKAFKRTRSRK